MDHIKHPFTYSLYDLYIADENNDVIPDPIPVQEKNVPMLEDEGDSVDTYHDNNDEDMSISTPDILDLTALNIVADNQRQMTSVKQTQTSARTPH